MSQWDAACRVPEWEALVYGPVLPDPVLLPHPGPKERHCSKPCHWENTAHSHYYCAQLPGSLHFTAFRLLLALITSGAVAQKHCLGLDQPDLSSLHSSSFWMCTTVMAPRLRSTSCTCSWRRSGIHLCRRTRSQSAFLHHSTATPGEKPTTTWSRVRKVEMYTFSFFLVFKLQYIYTYIW